jgi:hypothetical protein
VTNSKVTDASIDVFLALPNLRDLNVTGCKISDAGMERLQKHNGKLKVVRAVEKP